jgi:GNAT superfamily N-acetyltransferase
MALDTPPAPAAEAPIPLRDLRRVTARAVDIRARTGTGGIVVRAVQRLPRRVALTEWYGVLDTHTRARPPVVPAAGEIVRRATGDDRPALAALTGSDDLVAARLARGDEVVVTEVDGQVVAQAWFSTAEYDESNLLFAVRPWERWLYDGRVRDDLRGRGIHPRLLAAAMGMLADQGVLRVLSTIDHLNTPSQRAAGKRGARTIGTVLSCTVAGVTVSRVQWVGGRARWRVHRGPRRLTTPGA